MKIVSIVGTRPQFLKLAPLANKFKTSSIEHIIVHSGQHYDENMFNNIFTSLNMDQPDYIFNRSNDTKITTITKMMLDIEQVLLKEKPNKVIVFGDCDTTLAGALVANKLNIYLIHIEAGMRSFNKSMPEEINRILVDHISDLLLCTTNSSLTNLKNENITNNIHCIGNLQLELFDQVKGFYHNISILDNNKLEKNNYVLLTIHREYNTNKTQLNNIFSQLKEIKDRIVFPIHPRTKCIIKLNNIIIPNNIKLIEPVNYLDMNILIQYCKYIITDSGGIQPEAWYIGKICIIMRTETEWVDLLTNNTLFLYDYYTPLNVFIEKCLLLKPSNNIIKNNPSDMILELI